ncbi:prolactin receptor b [Platichthys flesus]|uniref:prolactin receptor b n=1 Tax=Platichthys flesus TaxID=8260 RepID=UPI002DC06365|nr:prolactin receptor b [Platichthys flesus]XP_062237517.1 prolactin receptor b [Platichthys flesus]XP_062237518.1 prolactin receptor b [Platichthys flesus]
MRTALGLALLLLLSAAVESNSMSPPGKPVLLGCRSPEKETFTCWWEPGSDGGLPTMHRFFYERERLEGTHECPDYLSAGKNSCFFDKGHTSIWVDYYLTVVASNALGNASSVPLKIDVMEIVMPDAPGNISLQVMKREDHPYLHVRWESPQNTDSQSGWVTIKYELRFIQEDDSEWKEYASGTQTQFNLYNIDPGSTYVVQVRCRLDHSSWSEWSNSTSVKTFNYRQREKPFWILLSSLSTVPFLTLCVLVMKRKRVKQCLLPPVPGPKIRGIDVQLLKRGRSEYVNNALIINQTFPSVSAWKEESEEYLIVSDDVRLPDLSSSQKRKKSLSIAAGLLFDFEIHCMELSPSQMDREKAEERKNEINNFANSSASLSGVGLLNKKTLPEAADQSSVQLLSICGYVDIQRHNSLQEVDYTRVKEVNGDNILLLHKDRVHGCEDVQTREENIPKDYSRVEEVVSNNQLLLQTQSTSSDSWKKSERYTVFTNKKSRNPHETEASVTKVGPELIVGEYVDTFPTPPLM